MSVLYRKVIQNHYNVLLKAKKDIEEGKRKVGDTAYIEGQIKAVEDIARQLKIKITKNIEHQE